MAGAHTRRGLARRDVEVEHGGKPEDAVIVKRDAGLQPQVEVATAGRPHFVPPGNARFIVCMFVVKGQASAHVQEVQQTESQVDPARKGAVPFVEAMSLAIGGVCTATAQAPGIQRKIATHANGEIPLAQGVGVLLVKTVGSGHQPALGEG